MALCKTFIALLNLLAGYENCNQAFVVTVFHITVEEFLPLETVDFSSMFKFMLKHLSKI